MFDVYKNYIFLNDLSYVCWLVEYLGIKVFIGYVVIIVVEVLIVGELGDIEFKCIYIFFKYYGMGMGCELMMCVLVYVCEIGVK